MESLFFLIPGALIFIAIAVKVLFWAIHSGQYDNLDSEAHRILFDDLDVNKKNQKKDQKKESQSPQSPTDSSSKETK